MPVLKRHRLAPDVEDGGFVHVVPHTVHAGGEEVAVEPAPPGAHRRVGEIGEDAGAGPDVAAEGISPCRGHPRVGLGTGVVDRVARLRLDAGIDHPHAVKSLRVQIAVERGGIGKRHRVEGEGAETVHVVDVHPDHVAGDVPAAELRGHLAHPRVGCIGVAALLVAQRPLRRERHVPGEIGQRPHHRLRRITVDHDHRKGRPVGDADDVAAQLDPRPVRRVEEHPEGAPVRSHRQHPGMGLVEVRRVGVVTVGIVVPAGDGATVAQERPSRHAGTIEVRSLRRRQDRRVAVLDHAELGDLGEVRRRRSQRGQRCNQRDGRAGRSLHFLGGVVTNDAFTDRLRHRSRDRPVGTGGKKECEQQNSADRSPHGVTTSQRGSSNPSRTGSGMSSTPNRSRTRSRISRARSRISRAVARFRFTRASVWRDEIAAPPRR